MTFELLKAGLQKLVDEDNNHEAKQAITEINEIQQRVGNNDAWNGECYVLHANTVDDLTNIATYDAYGKIYAKMHAIGHEVPFNEYENVCREKYGLYYAPLSVIQLAFDIISQLYSDNEADGAHNPDGTFNHDDRPNLDAMEKFISDNIDRIDTTDAYYIQYQQAKDVLKAWSDDIENDSPTAATDHATFTIGDNKLNVSCFNAEALGSFEDALLEIMQNAIENIYLG